MFPFSTARMISEAGWSWHQLAAVIVVVGNLKPSPVVLSAEPAPSPRSFDRHHMSTPRSDAANTGSSVITLSTTPPTHAWPPFVVRHVTGPCTAKPDALKSYWYRPVTDPSACVTAVNENVVSSVSPATVREWCPLPVSRSGPAAAASDNWSGATARSAPVQEARSVARP